MNKVIVIGNVVREVELQTNDEKYFVVSNSIAVKRTYKTNDGVTVDYINFQIWGNLSKSFSKYVKKGSKVGLIGSWQHRSYNAKDGTKKQSDILLVEQVEFLMTRESNTGEDENKVEENVQCGIDIAAEDLPF